MRIACMPSSRRPALLLACTTSRGGGALLPALMSSHKDRPSSAPLTRTVKRYSCPFSRELMDSL